ncbi:uncharacterized protein LOC124131390 isoform X2 [Haliotis rufescens]|uniref:uncharacterized protein LOC124131390 isoform X2 n=1 Tax=Haliotis rufescens TaxID=6454 RepID=UPI00201F153C|nr:uncharacterized protein LOC124131390 isoform X2 [Haliotis rufescens]
MEETSGNVSAVHFRHFGPDNARIGDRKCCAVVDICTNNDFADRQHHSHECMQLLHLHWEDIDSGSETSSISVSEAEADNKSSVITFDHVNKLLKDQAALHDFTRKMLTAHRVKLIHVVYAPLAMMFEHCGGSDMKTLLNERFKVFVIVKEFLLKTTGLQNLKGLHIGIHKSKTVSMETGLWCLHRVDEDGFANRRLTSMRSSSEDGGISIAIPSRVEKRFINIEEELFKQRQFMESQFNDQEKQYETIRVSLMKISQAFLNDRRQGPERLTSERQEEQQEPKPDRNLIDFDLEPYEDVSSLHLNIAAAYRPKIEILSDDDDDDDDDDDGVEEEERGDEKEKRGQGGNSVAEKKAETSTNCIGSEDVTEERQGESDGDLSDDVSVDEKMVLPNTSDVAAFDQSNEGTINSTHETQQNVFPDHGSDMYPSRNQQYENSHMYKKSYQTSGDRSQAVYGPDSSAQCESRYNGKQISQQPKREAAATPHEVTTIFEELLYGFSDMSSRQNAYSDMQSDAINVPVRYTETPNTCEEPKKEKIEGNQAKEQALRLMMECAISDSPYWSRIWESVQGALLEEESPAPRHDLALDTIICLDTSGSMRGEAFQEMKKITLDFINGIEDIAEQHDVEENIALVTFGGRAKVIHHLSNDYGSLRDALDKITPGGPSPILEGVIVSMAALAKGGIYRLNNRMELRPRMIFMSDGQPTTEMPESARDSHLLSSQDQIRILRAFQEIRSRQPSDDLPDEIIFVPVGQFCDMRAIEALASVCGGKVKDATSFAKLSNYLYLRKIAARAIEYVRQRGNETDIFLAGLRSLLTDLGPEIDKASTTEVYNVIVAYITSVSNDIMEEKDLPPLGTRVVRGPDWQWGNQDTEGPGTITNHAKDRIVWVIWDNDHSNSYRYGHGGKYDVTVVEDQPRVVSVSQVGVGVQVERGPAWHHLYGNQDGGIGSYGTIIRLMPGKVKVRWQNGEIHEYRYGMCGLVDVSFRDPIACILETTAKTIPHMDTVQDSANVQSTKDGDRPYVWQRKDEQNGWEQYSETNDAKMKKAYGKNQQGSCLVQRNEQNFRVSFRSLQERSLIDKTWVPVRKYCQ